MRKLVTVVAIFSAAACARASSGAAQSALDHALHGTAAVGIVLDAASGRTIAVERAQDAANMGGTPGSTLKPFFLAAALRSGKADAQTAFHCSGEMRIAGRNVACTHPREQNIFTAEQALAYSCNQYFVQLATRFEPGEAEAALREWGLDQREKRNASQSPEDRELLILGLQGIAVTPLQLAGAYRRLALYLANEPPSAEDVVRRGLRESVVFGMAHAADTAGMEISGKTGTASDPGQAWTHGWFAGFAPAKDSRMVIVIYVPRGNGADAAHLAHLFFAAYREEQRP